MRGGPGWGYGLGGPSQAVRDAGDPGFVVSSPPQPVTPFAGAHFSAAALHLQANDVDPESLTAT